MSRDWIYCAKIAPLGRNIGDPGDTPCVLDEQSFATWMARPWHVKVRDNHDVLANIGQLSDLRVRDGWYVCEFFLNRGHERELPVGQPVSVGVDVMRRSGLKLLQEVSIVHRGAIPGAQIISRRERQRVQRPPIPRAELESRLRKLGIDVKPGAFAPLRELPQPRPPVAAPPVVPPAPRRREAARAPRAWWETPAGQDAELRRRLEAADYAEGSWELVLEQMHDEIYLAEHGVPRLKLAA